MQLAHLYEYAQACGVSLSELILYLFGGSDDILTVDSNSHIRSVTRAMLLMVDEDQAAWAATTDTFMEAKRAHPQLRAVGVSGDGRVAAVRT